MTSLPVLQQNRIEPPPDCFGKHWDARAPECSGGVDLMFTNKATGSHVRERCRFFDSCGAKVQATRMAAQQAIQSYNFPAPAQSPQIQPVVSAAASRAQIPQMSQQMGPQAVQQQGQPMMLVQGQWHPAPTYQFNHGIPHYLTTPEPRRGGESIWVVLFRELLRGIIKSAGHTVSYFVDTTPLRQQLPPPPPPGAG